MSSGTGYPIEEFLEAITSQLDQTQDALRLKAVNRPLTFALKEFNVDLQVFVEMDASGRVTFRPAAPNEEGASKVSIGFTTITRPMIEENTISMEMAQAPSLGELGLGRDEERRLAKIGVRNGAQLRKMERDAGDQALSRHTGVDLGRIKQALQMARPRIDGDVPLGGAGVRPHNPLDRLRGDEAEVALVLDPVPTPVPAPQQQAAEGGLTERLRARLDRAPQTSTRRIQLRRDQQALTLSGANLIEGGRAPQARLNGDLLPIREVTMQGVQFDFPDGAQAGDLSVELPDGSVDHFALEIVEDQL